MAEPIEPLLVWIVFTPSSFDPIQAVRDSGGEVRTLTDLQAEPVAEYAALLADAVLDLPPDAAGGRPYRPWEIYEVGQCIQHLAWEDCGIVVGKEELPGGRMIIKVFFQEAGVVRLIEQADK